MMKKIFLVLLIYFFMVSIGYTAPSNSITVPNTFSANTVISSSETNSNNNEFQSKYNVHTHTDISQLGTVTTGTWNGTAVSTQYGGTGQDFSSKAQGEVLYFSATGTMASLGVGTDGQFLKTQGASSNPVWANDVFGAAASSIGWVKYNGTNEVIADHYNVSSITDGATGTATVNWDTDFGSGDYCVVAICSDRTTVIGTQAAGTTEINTYTTADAAVDAGAVYVLALGD